MGDAFNLQNLHMKLVLHFDGSCGPNNPGGTAGYGWILTDSSKEIARDSGVVCSGPEATNNVGEWGALRNGLRYLSDKGWTGELSIRGDSQLVICQLTGEYKCRKQTLIPYYKECILLLKNWQWDAKWIPREENEQCDSMSKTAYTDKVKPTKKKKTKTLVNLGEETPEYEG